MPLDPVLVQDVCSWLRKAHNDLRGARIDMDASPPLLEDALFHCQQAAEKGIKAFLAFHDEPFRKTHDLSALSAVCLGIDPGLESVLRAAAPLTEFAWKYRYPGDYEPPQQAAAERSFELAKAVYDAIATRLPDEIMQRPLF